MSNYFAIGISIFLYGVITLLNSFSLFYLNQEEILSVILITLGLVTFIKSFQQLKRGGLVLTTLLMNLGIILFVLTNYEILNWNNVITPSLFYITATFFVVLYIENTSELIFLVVAIFFFTFSIATILFADSLGIIKIIDSVTLILFDYWPLFLILFGIMLIAKRKTGILPTSVGKRGIRVTPE